jgi:hypothetical protein
MHEITTARPSHVGKNMFFKTRTLKKYEKAINSEGEDEKIKIKNQEGGRERGRKRKIKWGQFS